MTIVPFESVGNLLFSDTRQAIRKKLNEEYTSGIKGEDDFKEYYDYFEASALFVYYDSDDNLRAFEFFKSNPIFKGINLLETSYSKLVQLFLELDRNLVIEFDYFTSFEYGIGANAANDPEDENTFPEAVIVFKMGYYDALDSYFNE